MANSNSSLRFDHREIAVIFSLFVFVSLLMFTVGIVVGKGFSQAKYEKMLVEAKNATLNMSQLLQPPHPAPATTVNAIPSMSDRPVTQNPIVTERTLPKTTLSEPSTRTPETSPVQPTSDTRSPAGTTVQASETSPGSANANPARKVEDSAQSKKKEFEPLKLTPKPTKNLDVRAGSLREPNSKEAKDLLKDPRIAKLLEPAPASAARKAPKQVEAPPAITTSKTTDGFPQSFPSGKFTVQVGSYPSKKDAVERVEALQKLGFAHAYLTVKKFQEGEQPWYRIWLGYFPDFDAAKNSGDLLQRRGEVKNFLVRKSDLSDE